MCLHSNDASIEEAPQPPKVQQYQSKKNDSSQDLVILSDEDNFVAKSSTNKKPVDNIKVKESNFLVWLFFIFVLI
jgi:hypothetical protein